MTLKPVGFPSDVDVQIVPRTVHVIIEELQMKEVPVVINVKGTPAAGLKAGTAYCEASQGVYYSTDQ